MAQDTLEQARGIMQTVGLLKARMMRDHAEILRKGGGTPAFSELTLRQVNAVMAVHSRGQLTIKEVAAALGVSSPSASAMVDRLVELGLLIREQSQVDRREVLVRLSPDSEGHAAALEEQLLQSIVDVLDKLGPEYTHRWCEIYEQIRGILEREIAAEDAVS